MSLINTDINTNTCKCHLAIDNINIIAIIRSQYQYIVIDRHYCSALATNCSPKARIGLASESFCRVAFDGKFLLRDKIP